MRIRALSRYVPVDPCLVFDPSESAASAGDRPFPNGSTFVREIDGLREYYESSTLNTLFIYTSEHFLINICIEQWMDKAEHLAVVQLPKEDVETLAAFLSDRDGLSIVGLQVEGSHIEVVIGMGRPTDRLNTDLLFGIGLVGAVNRRGTVEQSTDLANRYLSVLQLLDEGIPLAHSQVVPAVDNSKPGVSDDRKQLLKKVDKANEQLAAQTLKYDALANSRAGKLTLKYWEMKKVWNR